MKEEIDIINNTYGIKINILYVFGYLCLERKKREKKEEEEIHVIDY